jgi:phosphopantothenoylcysteine decarboxylase/phosphopantothenate--cysteine ligase
VRVVMTAAAEKFISRLTMETLSQNPVAVDIFPDERFFGTHHINLADWTDAAIIAPASYNFIGKINSGIADDLLNTTVAALHCSVVIAPAMNVSMWNNPICQRNIKELIKLGYSICPPGEGFLAEGYSGKGRLADLHHLIQYLYRAVHPSKNSLKGQNILVTAGRTEEPIDPVRIFTNRSSGRMGFALAWEAFSRGAEVKIIHGPNELPKPEGIKTFPVQTAQEMFDNVKNNLKDVNIYLSAAAVADYTPQKYLHQKIKKKKDSLQISLKQTTDILNYVTSQKKQSQLVVGFAVETENPQENAKKKLERKKLDLIVLNNPTNKGAGFQLETNQVTLIHKNGHIKSLPVLSKLDVAFEIFEFLLKKE